MLENGPTVAAQSRLAASKIATKKEQLIARASRKTRFHIGQVGAVTTSRRAGRELEYDIGRNELQWDYVSTKSF
jgi:hypothetical protein